jgi:hypothetical protein
MTNSETDNLIASLPKPGGLRLFREVDRIVMDGGKWGAHTLSVGASSGERLLVHWKGYVESNGQTLGPAYSPPLVAAPASRDPTVPAVGEWVAFPSKSAPSGWRKGQVVKVTNKRALIAFRFKYEQEFDRRKGLKFDPSNATKTWRKLTEIKRK